MCFFNLVSMLLNTFFNYREYIRGTRFSRGTRAFVFRISARKAFWGGLGSGLCCLDAVFGGLLEVLRPSWSCRERGLEDPVAKRAPEPRAQEYTLIQNNYEITPEGSGSSGFPFLHIFSLKTIVKSLRRAPDPLAFIFLTFSV